ncbi:hypothetical protein DE146DRAFT_633627 [Phaeosphaeria sp. MPI-PUGE-AT-0046c]|nr:hypothetical protein DE146DRAFT_633627 [Phaeosphaeria sp. MPI-PUGE-AT-0046c]
MANPTHYTLADFERLGLKKFPVGYKVVADEAQYTFRLKTFHAEANVLHYKLMLRVGHFHYKNDGPTVWALLLGDHAQYFYGREAVVESVEQSLESKVYFAKPFNFFAGLQEADASNNAKVDMFLLFVIACLTFESDRAEYIDVQRIKMEPGIAKPHNLKEESPDYDDMSSASLSPSYATRPSQYISSDHVQLSSITELIKKYGEQVSAKSVQDRDALDREVQALEAKLEEQEQSNLNAEEERNAVQAHEEIQWQEREIAQLDEQYTKLEQSSKKWQADSQKYSKQYEGLKRKLQSVMKDDAEPARKTTKY